MWVSAQKTARPVSPLLWGFTDAVKVQGAFNQSNRLTVDTIKMGEIQCNGFPDGQKIFSCEINAEINIIYK